MANKPCICGYLTLEANSLVFGCMPVEGGKRPVGRVFSEAALLPTFPSYYYNTRAKKKGTRSGAFFADSTGLADFNLMLAHLFAVEGQREAQHAVG
jgi:hypothetical protein